MGNSSSSDDTPTPVNKVVEDDETSKLDPKIKAFLLDGTKYTSSSISKEVPLPQAKPFIPVQANANLDPDLVAVRALKLLAPLFPGPKTQRWFPEGAEERFYKNLPKVDVWPLLMALQDFQGYLNDSGVKIGNSQTVLNQRIRTTEILMTKVLHSCALLGTEIQNFEMGIRNIHVMEHNIRMTTEKLNTTLKKTFTVLDMIPNYERASLIPPFEVLKPFLRKDQYVSLNLLTLTRYCPEITAKEREIEDFWLQNILPHWDDALIARKAVGWWRAGIPARLRGYVWKRLIGNHLQITPSVYTEWQEKAQLKFGPPPDDIYDESSQEDSETIVKNAQVAAPQPPSQVSTPAAVLNQSRDDGKPTTPAEETKPQPVTSAEETPKTQKPEVDVKLEVVGEPETAVDADKPEATVEKPTENTQPDTDSSSPQDKPTDSTPSNTTDTQPSPSTPDASEKPVTEPATPTNGHPPEQTPPTGADPEKPQEAQPSAPTTDDPTSSPQSTTRVDPVKLKSIVDQFQAKVYPNRPNARQIIIRDVPRTLPDLRIFDKLSTPAARQLLGVLETAAIFTDTGYIQGMSYLCGVLLMFMNHYDAFVTFTNLIELPFLKSVCKIDLGLIAKHSQLFQMVFLQNMPALYNHFNREGVTTEHFLLDWWLTLFSKSVSLPVAFRIWDCFLVEGELFLHLAAVGILKVFENELMGASFESCLDSLSQIPRKVSADALFEAIKKFTITPKIQAIIDEMHR